MTKEQQNIKWTDVRNVWPIALALITVAGAFFNLGSKIDVMNERLGNLIARIDKNDIIFTDHEGRLRSLEDQVNTNTVDIEVLKN